MARVCREYGMNYWDVLKLPLKTFWSFNRQVDRLRAEVEQRQLRVANAATNAEACKQLGEVLESEIGKPLVVEKKFDADAFGDLRSKFGNGRVSADTHSLED